MTRKAKGERGSSGSRITRVAYVPVALGLLVLGALALVVGVLSNSPEAGPTPPVSQQASGEALAGEPAEETEQARGREEALAQARRQGTLGLIEPLAVKAARG